MQETSKRHSRHIKWSSGAHWLLMMAILITTTSLSCKALPQPASITHTKQFNHLSVLETPLAGLHALATTNDGLLYQIPSTLTGNQQYTLQDSSVAAFTSTVLNAASLSPDHIVVVYQDSGAKFQLFKPTTAGGTTLRASSSSSTRGSLQYSSTLSTKN